MKLHTLHIENLNSLRGTHDIDFERLFSVSTIVLIAGETGAGKSTILDAVHLALFGRTPRLQSPAGSTRTEQGVEHVMTRGTGHCAVKLEFSVLTEHGQREKYQAIWGLHRAHRKADGRVQSPSQSFARYDEASGKYIDMLEHGEHPNLSSARHHVLRGMSEDDFMRSVLLPQGQFDALLNADEQTRSDALKRIVPVDHIKEIGKKVAEFAREAKLELDTENNRLGMQEESLLSDEDYTAYVKKLKTLQADATKNEAAAKVLEERVQWNSRDKELRRADDEANNRHQDVQKEHSQASEDRTALAEHERLHDAWNVWLRCREMEKDTPSLKEAVEEAVVETKTKTGRFKTVQKSVNDARKMLEQQRAAQTKQQPTLKEAYAAWDALETTKHRLKNAEETHTHAVTTAEEQQKRLVARKEDAAKSLKELRAAESKLARFEMSREAPAAQPNIEDLFRRGEGLQIAYQGTLVPAQNAKRKVEALETERKKLADRARKHLDNVTQWTADARRAHTQAPWTVAPSLQPDEGATIPFDAPEQWIERLTDDLAQLKDYGVALGELAKQRKKLGTLEENHSKICKEVQSAERTRKAAAESLEACEKSLKEREEVLEAHRKTLETQKRYLELVDELKDTDTCPVCGTESPPAHAEERRQSVQEELATTQRHATKAARVAAVAKTEVDKAAKALKDAQNKALVVATRAESVGNEISNARCDAEQQREAISTHELSEHIPPAGDVKALDAQLVSLRQKYSAIAAAVKICRTLREAGNELKIVAEKHRTQREHLEKQQTDALQDRKLTDAARTSAHNALGTWARSARSALDTPNFVRWQCTASDDFDNDVSELIAALETVNSTLKDYSDTLKECTRLKELAAKAEAECTAQNKELEKANTARDASKSAKESAISAVEDALKRTKTFFEGKHPRDVEAGWKKSIDALQTALDTQRDAFEETQNALQAATAAQNTATARRDDHAKALRTESEKLQSILTALGIESTDTLVKRRLSDDTAQKLKSTLADIDKRLHEAKTTHRIAAKSLKAHQLRRKEIGEPASNDADKLQALREKINALHTEIGAVSTKIETDTALRKTLAEAGERLKTLKREHQEWDVLRQLVGAREGEAFSKFALALSLGELIAHANDQLKSIAPRYTLQQRFTEAHVPLIDFEIIDHHFAGEARPISNLSGGERFQLSLAMALGLSSMSRSILPVETLLIDEGFGTLDPVTLDQAIHTLESLYQRTGARVGLISHVERLRERLPTQIIVRKQGNGHSTLDVRDGLAVS